MNLIILPTAPLLSRPPVSPLVSIVKRTTDKVFASSTFGLFSPRGNKLASSAAATFSSFKTFHSHGTSSPVDPRARGVIRASGITENLSAVCRLSKDGWRSRLKQDQEDQPKTKQDHLPVLERHVWSSSALRARVALWDGIRVNVQLEEKGDGGVSNSSGCLGSGSAPTAPLYFFPSRNGIGEKGCGGGVNSRRQISSIWIPPLLVLPPPLLFYGTSIRRKCDDISPAGTSARLFDATGYQTRDKGDKHTKASCEENNGSEFG